MADGSKSPYWVGFDLGGTKMLAKVYDANFRELGQERKGPRSMAGPRQGWRGSSRPFARRWKARGLTQNSWAGSASVFPVRWTWRAARCWKPSIWAGRTCRSARRWSVNSAVRPSLPTTSTSACTASTALERPSRHAVRSACSRAPASAAAASTRARSFAASTVRSWRSATSRSTRTASSAGAAVTGAWRPKPAAWRLPPKSPRRPIAVKPLT